MKVTIKRTTGHGPDLVFKGVERFSFDGCFNVIVLLFPDDRRIVYHVSCAVVEKEGAE